MKQATVNQKRRALRQLGTRYLCHPANRVVRATPKPTTAQLMKSWHEMKEKRS